MSKNDGGPAFPSVKTDRQYTTDINVHSVGGMSLRDYFAAKALAGLMGRTWNEYSNNELAKVWVTSAYAISDLMLAERTK